MNPSDHLRPETLFGYEHQLLSPEELREVHYHIAECTACRQALARRMDVDGMITDVRAAMPAPSQTGWSLVRYAAAAAIVLLAAGAFWLAHRSSEPAVVEGALRTGRILLPAFLDQLGPTSQVLMGGAGASAATLLSPKATAVLEPAVEFQWQPISGEWTYQVRVFSLTGEPAASSPEISQTRWTANLSRGSDYQWQVTATRGAERVTLPPPSETAPRFRVLDSAAAERLRDLARRQPGEHLLLGVEYGRAGLIDDARRELTEASHLDPKRTAIRDLLQSLAAR